MEQRLSFARMFVRLELMKIAHDSTNPFFELSHLPSGMIVVLDESASGLEGNLEKHIYRELRKELLLLDPPNGNGRLYAICSIGHRESLPEFHDSEVEIGSDMQEDKMKNVQIIAQGSWRTPDGKHLPWKHVVRR